MKLTLKKATENYNALAAVAEKKLPVKLSYAISKNLAKLQPEYELVQKARMDLLDQYGKKDQEGNLVIEDNCYQLSDAEAFNREMREYIDTEIEVDIHLVSTDELSKLEEFRYDILTPAELVSLEFIFQGENQ